MPPTESTIEVNVHFYSFFKDLAGCSSISLKMPADSTLAELLNLLAARFPKLEQMQRSMLMAVGVEYQDRTYILHPGDEVSLFPPVQGG
jgi:molybdopterin converting factor small subunit